jgi:hypothetical protein
MSYPTVQGRIVEGVPYREARVDLGTRFASSFYLFFLSGTSTPTNVYQDGALTTPFSPTGKVTADAFGRFPAIYLDPSVIYRVQFFNSASVMQWQQDPYVSQLSTVGTSALSAFGINIAPTGEFTMPAPNTGGSGVTLTLDAGKLGSTPLRLNGTVPGTSTLIVNDAATTGTQTATFAATNKPGTPPTSFSVTATAAPTGATYTGGTLTATFTGATASNYTVQLSTGQNILNATFTNGSATFTTPSTNITGTPTAALTVVVPVTPAGWLPITCDGVQYYTPIWHGNPFTPYTPAPTGAVIHIFTTPGSATEAIIAGPSGTVQCEAFGAGGGGARAAIGGAGGLAYSLYSATTLGGAGATLNYTVGAGGAGTTFSGSAGSASTISAGTATGFTAMSGNGGGGAGGPPGPTFGGTGGTATGGNNSNTTGTAGSSTGLAGFIANDGSPYGGGGPAATTGQNGAIVFYYT